MNNPNDRGGATNRGVTQRVYDDWRVRNGKGRQPVSGISTEEVEAIYRDGYWNPIKGDKMPAPVDLAMLDAAVNVGPKQAVKWLQRAVGATTDGDIGPQTLAAVAMCDAQHVAAQINAQRRDFYEYLAGKDATQKVFLAGWMNRVNALSENMA